MTSPPPAITQIVTGSGNVFSATGDVVVSYNLSPPGAEDRQNLLHLAAQVRQVWIRDVLEDSVHHAALLDLRMRTDPGAVEHPWERVLVKGSEPGRVLPRETRIGEVFDEVGRMLLILGDPGSGKTTTLLTLARECLDRAEVDPMAPVPLVLNLSGWARSRRPLHLWLEAELKRRHHTGRRFARRWLKGHRLLLFLDGLDEVVEERRAMCVAALDAYVEEYGVAGMAVCCRVQDYRRLGVRLRLGGSVELLPLSQAQINDYVDAAGGRLDGLRTALAANEKLRQLAEVPVMLNVMTLAARDAPVAALRFDGASDLDELREGIFNLYVDRMFARRGQDDRGFSRERTVGWLRWLACAMSRRSEGDFAMELLQPSWLTRRQLMLYTLVSRVLIAIALAVGTVGLWAITSPPINSLADRINALGGVKPRADLPAWLTAIEVADVLLYCIVVGAVVGLLCFPFDYPRLRRVRRGVERALVTRVLRSVGRYCAYIFVGISGWFLAAILEFLVAGRRNMTPDALNSLMVWYACVVFPIALGVMDGRGHGERDIGTPGPLAWRWRAAAVGFAKGLIGFGIPLGAMMIFLPRNELPAATALLLMLACASGVWAGWRSSSVSFEPGATVRPLSWGANAVRGALNVTGSVTLLLLVANVLTPDWLPLVVAILAFPLLSFVILGIPALFWFGGTDLVLHISLLLVLWMTGTLPLRPRRFMAYAVHLGFLQRAGGGYRFFHAYLQDYFTALSAT